MRDKIEGLLADLVILTLLGLILFNVYLIFHVFNTAEERRSWHHGSYIEPINFEIRRN